MISCLPNWILEEYHNIFALQVVGKYYPFVHVSGMYVVFVPPISSVKLRSWNSYKVSRMKLLDVYLTPLLTFFQILTIFCYCWWFNIHNLISFFSLEMYLFDLWFFHLFPGCLFHVVGYCIMLSFFSWCAKSLLTDLNFVSRFGCLWAVYGCQWCN